MAHLIIRTTAANWWMFLSECYRFKQAVLLIDDAQIGVLPSSDPVFDAWLKPKMSAREVGAVCVSLGLSFIGVCLIVLALALPELNSRLGLLVGGGVVAFLLGGAMALVILTKRMKAPNVSYTTAGEIKIEWQ